jgi:Zn-dependent protease with chaperone function
MNRTKFVSRPAAALAVVLAMSVGIASAQTRVKAGFNLFSPTDDAQIGAQSAVEAEQQLPIVRDGDVNAYVNRIGQRLAANAGGPQFRYQFKVVNASDINAFALPGGYVYVNRGVLEQARNEGEVAGVLAHEISHVSLRHGTHQASKAYLAQAGISILGGILGGKVGQGTAQVINAVGGVGLNALFLKYSRDLETQADIRGSQILAASGYSPIDMVNFFQTLENVDKARKTSWLSDHPAPPDRIARIQQESRLLRVSQSPTTNVAELRSVQSRLRGSGAAPTMAQIARSGPAAATQSGRRRPTSQASSATSIPAPSTSLRSYTSPSGMYRISYPSNWQVFQEGSTGVTMGPPGGIGNVNGNAEIVVGAIINHYDPFGGRSASYFGNATIENATNDLLATLQQSSPYLRLVSGSEERVRLAGGTAVAATLRGVDPQTGIDERVTVVTRQLADEHLLYLLFIAPERDAANYRAVVNAMVSSMQIDPQRRH